MNKKLTTGLLALTLIAGGSWLFAPGQTGSGAQITLPGAAMAQEAGEEISIMEMTLGAEDAPIEVIEYASYTCPHCARFHEDVFGKIKTDYIDTGKVRFTYREVYFDKYGMWASLIARCGDDAQRFFGMTGMIYKTQSTWARAGSDGAIADELRKLALLAGLENDTLDTCLSDGEKLRALVGWFQENALEHDITSTPSFVVNGTKIGNLNYADFSALLDSELAKAQ